MESLTLDQLIEFDHQTLRECISAFRMDSDKYARIHRAKEFLRVWSEHCFAEEEVLYKALRSFPDFHQIILESYEEHSITCRIADELKTQIKRQSLLSESLEAKVKVLANFIEPHIVREEHEILSFLPEFFTEEQRIALGTQFIHVRGWHQQDFLDFPKAFVESQS